ncbi:MAG: hypothetical protein ACLQD8_04815 [Thermoplasmata archaeon]
MEPDLDPRLVALFGSETRVRTLAVLASAHAPMTAYRIGKVGGVSMPKVYREVARLEMAGLIEAHQAGWVLLDRDVRALLRKRIRISWAPDWLAERTRRLPGERALFERLRKTPHARPSPGWQPRDPKRFQRSAFKDEILRNMGLRTSSHGDQG